MKLCHKILLQALLSGLCLANPAKPLLVISTRGPVPVELASGTILDAEAVFTVPARSQVTLLLLGQGKRLRLTGPCTARWDASEGTLKLDRGNPEELSGSEHKLQLSGENTRILAGITTRKAEQPKICDNPWRFELDPGLPGLLVLSQKSGLPLPSEIQLEMPCLPYEFEADLSRLTRGSAEPLWTQSFPKPVFQQVDGRQVLKLPIPEKFTGRLGVRLVQEDKSCYFSCVRPWSPEEAQELAALKESTADWSESEPDNPEPYVIYAVAAEEMGQLEDAQQAVEAALKIRQDAGLYRLACRIQVQRGNYASAVQLYRKASDLGPPRKGL